MVIENIVLVTGGVLTGLLAGVFYAFSVAIVPGLRKARAAAHIDVMQRINTEIKNPIFFLSFFGPVILLPLAAFLLRGGAAFWWLVVAAILHIVGGVGVTAAGNIPLNEKLDKVEVSGLSDEEAERIRGEFQGPYSPWMRWHAVRTIASIVATALVFVACLVVNGKW